MDRGAWQVRVGASPCKESDMTEQLTLSLGLTGGPNGKEPACQFRKRNFRDVGSIPGQEDPLEEGLVSHSSIPAWRIPWKEEPGGLQSVGSLGVGHDSQTKIDHSLPLDT